MCFWEILAKPQNVGYKTIGSIEATPLFFSTRDMMIWRPREYSIMFSGPVEYSIDPFLGDPQVKNRKKIDFFRFFQKLSKSSENIEFCLKNILNTPRGQFLPIFHNISQYKPLQKKRLFSYENRDFLRFFTFFEF